MENSSSCRKPLKQEDTSEGTPALDEGSNIWEGEVNIIHLPSEILDKVLQYLSHHEISKAREVCRHFRDVGNSILNRGFCTLKDCTEQLLAKTNDELKATLFQLRQEENNSRKKQVAIEQMRCLRMLDVINAQLRLVRAVCYRYIFLNDISCSFFAGKIIDVINGFLRLVRLRTIEEEDAKEVNGIMKLVNKFTDFFHNRIEPTLVANEAAGNRATLFGSKVIDLLDCLLDCDKNVDVRLDSEGWCHLEGEYKVFVDIYTNYSSKNYFTGHLQQLSIKGQRSLHKWLCYLINRWSQFYVVDKEQPQNFYSPVDSFSFCSGSYEEPAQCVSSPYFRGCFCSSHYRSRFFEGNDIDNSIEEAVTFKLKMRCRKELAPLEKLLEWRKNSSDEEHSEAERSSEKTGYDLAMRLEILLLSSDEDDNDWEPLYKCFIKQKYLQEDPLPNPAKTEQVIKIMPLKAIINYDVNSCGTKQTT